MIFFYWSSLTVHLIFALLSQTQSRRLWLSELLKSSYSGCLWFTSRASWLGRREYDDVVSVFRQKSTGSCRRSRSRTVLAATLTHPAIMFRQSPSCQRPTLANRRSRAATSLSFFWSLAHSCLLGPGFSAALPSTWVVNCVVACGQAPVFVKVKIV